MKNLVEISKKRAFTKNTFPFEAVGACNNCKFYDSSVDDSYCTNIDGFFEGKEVSSFSPYSLMNGLGFREKMIGCSKIYVNGFSDIDVLNLTPAGSYLRKKIESSGLFDVEMPKYNVGDLEKLYYNEIKNLLNPLYKQDVDKK